MIEVSAVALLALACAISLPYLVLMGFMLTVINRRMDRIEDRMTKPKGN